MVIFAHAIIKFYNYWLYSFTTKQGTKVFKRFYAKTLTPMGSCVQSAKNGTHFWRSS